MRDRPNRAPADTLFARLGELQPLVAGLLGD
jgi:hypothetical protein